MALIDGHGTPMAASTASASIHEVKLIESTVDKVRVPKVGRGHPKTKLKRLVYDAAADSDPLRKRLRRGALI